jgi:uncharacterized membrane protein YqiK
MSQRCFPPPWSAEETAQAEVAVQQRQQELAQEQIKAEIAVTQATGRANSVRAETQAQADATTLRGNAEASAIKAKGDALAANPNSRLRNPRQRRSVPTLGRPRRPEQVYQQSWTAKTAAE